MQVEGAVEEAVVGHRVVEVEEGVVLLRKEGQDSTAHGSNTGEFCSCRLTYWHPTTNNITVTRERMKKRRLLLKAPMWKKKTLMT